MFMFRVIPDSVGMLHVCLDVSAMQRASQLKDDFTHVLGGVSST